MRDQTLDFLKDRLRLELCVQYRPNQYPGMWQGLTAIKAGVGNPCHVNAHITMMGRVEEEEGKESHTQLWSCTPLDTTCHWQD